MTLLQVTLLIVVGLRPAVLQAQGIGPLDELKSFSTAIRSLTTRVMPAVVQIVVEGYVSEQEDLSHPVTQFSKQRSSGSGVVVDPAGYIVTNAHVVRGAVSIQVLVPPPSLPSPEPSSRLGVRTYAASVLGIDRTSDLALIRIKAEHLAALKFGNSASLVQGDLVLAIGSPLGLRNSLSMGVVSAPARSISEDNPILYIQTDASINPGNSGGALLDTNGDLIGINSFIASQSGGNEGIGFAVPSELVKNVYQQLRETGKVTRGTIGLFLQNISPVMAAGLSLPYSAGVVIADVEPDSPAERAGLKRRDVVLKLEEQPVSSARDLGNRVFWIPVGRQVKLTVQRGENVMSFEPEVQGRSEEASPLAGLVSPENNLIRRLGIFCVELDKSIADINPDLRRHYGLIVAAKASGGEAQFLDLQPADIIHAVNNSPMATLDAFRQKIEAFKRGDAVVLQIERDGRFRFVAFEIE